MNKIAIYGVGALASKLLLYNIRYQLFEVAAFIDDNETKAGFYNEIPVLSYKDFINRFAGQEQPKVLVSVGYTGCNVYRENTCKKVMDHGFELANFIAPNSNCWPNTIKGTNVIVLDNVFIGDDCEIETGVILCPGTVLSHGVKVGAYSFFSDGVVVGGNARIGKNSFVGLNSTIKSSVKIGSYNIIGSAANVIHDTPDFSVTKGNPGITTPKDTLHTKI